MINLKNYEKIYELANICFQGYLVEKNIEVSLRLAKILAEKKYPNGISLLAHHILMVMVLHVIMIRLLSYIMKQLVLVVLMHIMG